MHTFDSDDENTPSKRKTISQKDIAPSDCIVAKRFQLNWSVSVWSSLHKYMALIESSCYHLRLIRLFQPRCYSSGETTNTGGAKKVGDQSTTALRVSSPSALQNPFWSILSVPLFLLLLLFLFAYLMQASWNCLPSRLLLNWVDKRRENLLQWWTQSSLSTA